MDRRRLLLAAAGALAGLTVALGVIATGRATPEIAPGEQYLLPGPLPAPDAELTAHTGESVRLGELGRDRLLAVFFGYTHCPDVCPLTMANLGQALQRLGPGAAGVQGVLITVDPARDSVARLAEYVARFPGSILGLTGTEEALKATARGYMVYAERAPDAPPHEHDEPPEPYPDDHYLIDHSGRTLVVQDGSIVMTFAPQASAAEIAEGLGLLLRR